MQAERRQLKVIFTGQSGLAKRSLLAELQNYAEASGQQVRVFSIGEMMYEISEAQPGRILNLPLDKLELKRAQVFQQVQEFINEHADHDIFIDTHATFRWEGGLFPGFSVQEIRTLRPNLCITFIADVDQIKMGLAYSDFPLNLSLRDIMVWREEEILGSGLAAAIAECDPYVVPRRINVESLYRLIYKPDDKKLYLSFPISRNPPKAVAKQIKDFRQRFHDLEDVVIFDPLEVIQEPRLISALNKTLTKCPNAKRVEVETSEQRVHLDVGELKEIKSYIDSQTRAFDYRMVEQSDAIVAFIPENNNEAYHADGVIMEIAYAQYKAREVYLIWPSDENPSPMIKPDIHFRTIDDAIQFFNS